MVEKEKSKGHKQLITVFVILTLIFFGILIGYSINSIQIREISQESKDQSKESKILSIENQKRIQDIQESRVRSCKHTYSGINDVFKYFYPPPPRTKKQKQDILKFNIRLNELKQNCNKQTKPSKEG